MSVQPTLLRRGLARAIDATILAAIAVPAGRATGYGIPWLAATATATFGYFVAGDVVTSRTVGKALLNLRVTDDDSARPTVRAAATRESFVLVGAVPVVGPVLALASWIAIGVAAHAGRMGFHDRVARTRVGTG